jgi:hypothetical protein
MNPTSIFIPVCAQVLVTFVVWNWMFFARLGGIKRHRARLQDLAIPEREAEVFRDATNPSDNFENLFELPTLFYVAAIVIFTAGLTDSLYVGAAWAFVLSRAAHSLIHCSCNSVLLRFYAYFAGSVILWLVWARLGWQLLSRSPSS